mmetsp:Transcript_5929/g.13780  ORF Transcript_5929/g.13780 Transcript_5929/m.13780 type:complete len:269 (+) Transcript_5929:13-819(+)
MATCCCCCRCCRGSPQQSLDCRGALARCAVGRREVAGWARAVGRRAAARRAVARRRRITQAHVGRGRMPAQPRRHAAALARGAHVADGRRARRVGQRDAAGAEPHPAGPISASRPAHHPALSDPGTWWRRRRAHANQRNGDRRGAGRCAVRGLGGLPVALVVDAHAPRRSGEEEPAGVVQGLARKGLARAARHLIRTLVEPARRRRARGRHLAHHAARGRLGRGAAPATREHGAQGRARLAPERGLHHHKRAAVRRGLAGRPRRRRAA